jgi:hypothetical protein
MKVTLVTSVLGFTLALGAGSDVAARAQSMDISIGLRAYEGQGLRTDGDALAADAGSPEGFALIDLNGGDLVDGDAVALRNGSGAYLQAANAGGSTLAFAMVDIGSWETFRIFAVDNPGGIIEQGSAVALMTGDGVSFVLAQNGGGSTVDATGTSSQGHSKFQILLN